MWHKNLDAAVCVTLLAMAASAFVQIRTAYVFPTESPGGIQLGDSPLFFSPYVGFAVARDDNIFTTKTNKKASTLTLTSPGFRIDARRPGMVFQSNYQAQIGRYAHSEDDNHWDHTARLQVHT